MWGSTRGAAQGGQAMVGQSPVARFGLCAEVLREREGGDEGSWGQEGGLAGALGGAAEVLRGGRSLLGAQAPRAKDEQTFNTPTRRGRRGQEGEREKKGSRVRGGKRGGMPGARDFFF